MHDETKRAAAFEQGSRYLASKGTAAIDELQRQIDRARQLLASGEVAPDLAKQPPLAPPYEWELTTPPLNKPKRIWLANVEDIATGQGQSVHAFACLAMDGDEVRRHLAALIGRTLAHAAIVGDGLDAAVPFARALLPDRVFRELKEIADGSARASAAMTFFASYHVNPH